MSDIQLYLVEATKLNNQEEARKLAERSAKRLETKELKLVQLIEQIGEYLNNEDGAIRGRAIAYLADVLNAVPQKGVLSRQQRDLLCDFILSRVTDDDQGVASCAKALIALEERGKWDDERAVTVMTAFLEGTHPLKQIGIQSERYAVLMLMDLLMAKYRNALRSLHETKHTFMSQFISYFDGEKDPRNLMLIFSILLVPFSEWDLRSDAQESFESVFNYFPITFKQPPNDPYGITAQDLKDRLQACIAANSEFAPYAFPALLDKLDSSSMNTKRDCLAAINACITEFGPQTVALYSVTLWDSLKFEILNVQEEDLAEAALKALAQIAIQLSKGTSGSLAAYLKPIVKECNEHLEDAPTKQSQASGRILNAIMKASAGVSNSLISATLPHLFNLYQGTQSLAKRRGLLEVLVQLLRSNVVVFGEWYLTEATVSTSDAASEPLKIGHDALKADDSARNALQDFKAQAIELLVGAFYRLPINEVSFRLLLIDALLLLARIRQLLSDEEIDKVVKLMDNTVIDEELYGAGEVKIAAINALVALAHQKPQVVVANAFPAFMAKIPDTDSDGFHRYDVLEAFAKLGSEEKVFDTVVVRLRNKLNAAIHQGASQSYLLALVSSLLYVFAENSGHIKEDSKRTHYYRDVAMPLLAEVQGYDAAKPLEAGSFTRDEVLDRVGRLSNIILRPLPANMQQEFAGGICGINAESQASIVALTDQDTPPQRRQALIVSTNLLAAFRKDVNLPYDVKSLLYNQVDFALRHDPSPSARAAVLKQISLLVNKFVPNQEIKAALEPILYQPRDLLNPSNLTSYSIRVLFSIVKAIIIRNSPSTNTMVPALLDMLSDANNGHTVARGFSTLLQPDDIITKENHCTISGLHKQKFFALTVPKIAAAVRTAQPEAKTNHLIALSGILRWLPYSTIESDLPSLATLLLQSLDLQGEEDIKAAAISILISVLQNNQAAIEEHAGSLISRLLTNATTSQSQQVRANALQCLALVATQLKTEVVLPYRRQVLKKLMPALDDKKRAVRTEAVKCSAKWTDVDEVDQEDE